VSVRAVVAVAGIRGARVGDAEGGAEPLDSASGLLWPPVVEPLNDSSCAAASGALQLRVAHYTKDYLTGKVCRNSTQTPQANSTSIKHQQQ